MNIRSLEASDPDIVLSMMTEYPISFPSFVRGRYPDRWTCFLDSKGKKHSELCGYYVSQGEAGNVMGHAGFLYNDELGHYEIVGVVVKKGCERQGVGQALLHAICEKVRQLGQEKIILFTLDHADTQAAMHFYKGIGFELTSVENDYYAPGFHRATFLKTLK